jgi:hypothetical protein
MTTSSITIEGDVLTQTVPPALPIAPDQYNRQYQDQLNSVLRLYFNTLNGLLSQLKPIPVPYGSFADTTNQTVAAVDTATVMTFNTTDFADKVSIVTSGGKASRITVAADGVYNFQWSGQFQNTTSAVHDASIWVRKNGVDVVGSSGLVSIPSRHGSVDGHTIAGWNFLFSLVANDYIELWWETDDVAVSIQAYPAVTTPAPAVRPSTSSLVATMSFIGKV